MITGKNINQKMGCLMQYRSSKTTRAEQKTFLILEQRYRLNPGRTWKEKGVLRCVLLACASPGTTRIRPKPRVCQGLSPFPESFLPSLKHFCCSLQHEHLQAPHAGGHAPSFSLPLSWPPCCCFCLWPQLPQP